MHSSDRSCRYSIQDIFFWRLAGPVAPTGKAIVHWIGCINAIKTLIQPISHGGLKMPCIKKIVQTSQIMWVKRLTNPINAKWKQLSWFLLNTEPPYIFKKRLYYAIENKPATEYYQDLLRNWYDRISFEPARL